MAKNKKSKILAMALCASVMAGIYASPVMARDIHLDNNSSVTTGNTTSTGGYTQNEVRVNISDGISSDTIGTFYSNEEEAGFKTDYTMTASTFKLEAEGRTWASLTVNGLTYTNPNTLNNVSLTADGLTFSNLNSEATAVLNAAAINSWNEKTQNINVTRTSADKTAFDGSVIADSFGTTKVNGTRAFWVNEDGMIHAAKNKFTVGAEGEVSATNFNGIALEKNNSNEILLDSINVTQLSNNTAGITHENVTKNITKTNIENSSITSAGELYINKANGQTNFSVDKYGNANVRNNLIANGISVNNGKFTVTKYGTVHSDGTVFSEEDFKITDKAGNLKYSLKTIGTNTAGITRENVTKNITKTNIENSSITSAGELYINKANGQTNFSVDKYGNANVRNNLIANGISVNNGKFTVTKYGTVHSDGTVFSEEDFKITDKAGNLKYSLKAVGEDLKTLTGNVGNIGGNVKHIEHYDNFAINGHEYDATVIEESVAITKDRGIDVIGANGASVATITRQGVARFGAESDANVRIENGGVYVNGSYNNHVASLSKDGLTLGAENLNEAQLSNINNVIGEGGVVTAADGSVIGGVGFTSGAMTNVVSINGASVEAVGNGGLKISGVELENGLINGVNINDLDKAVAGTSANIGGIERSEGAGDPGTGTTTIENNLKVSGDKINMFGDTGLTFEHGTMNNVDIINVSGNIGFNGSNVHFSYGSDGKTTTLGGLALTVDQIATDVSAIKEKTDHITVDDKGNVTISADDGSSLTVGKDGTSTGQGGQVTTDGNHTVNGDLDVDGSGQIDKDLTVGGDLEVGGKIDASEVNVGNTHITKDNGIETDKITVSGQGGSAIINGGYVGGSNDVFIDANGNNIFDEGETSLSGVDGKVDKVASDLGDVSILDPEIAGDSNNDGQNDVVGAVNNEAEIRRNEIERVDGRINNLENRVGELEDRIDKVGAMAAAIANLRTMGYDPAAPTEVAVGIGQYRDETGAALGLFHYPNRDFMLSLSVSTSGDEVMGGIGATWKFGRKSPEKVAEIKKAQAEADVRRAEEAKLAKAEEMKQAAKEAKIKAQQERHAKLAAERAAQAEAAK